MEYNYYILSYNGIETLYRMRKGKIHGNSETLEAFYNGTWNFEEKPIKMFMNKYVTGWLNEEDAMNYETAIALLSKKITDAKSFAIEKHNNQKYGIFPYEVHLLNVITVLLRNNILPNTEDNIDLWIGAWLHDILEDTNTTKQELVDKFGINIYEIVWSLTDGKNGNRYEKKQLMYKKLIHNQNGIIVKLADRISNIEFSVICNNREKVQKYISENDELNKQLKNIVTNGNGKFLLDYLNKLVMNLAIIK